MGRKSTKPKIIDAAEKLLAEKVMMAPLSERYVVPLG